MSDSANSWTVRYQAPLSSTISWSLLKFMSIELVMPSNLLILCCPLFLLPSIFPCIRFFSNKSALCIKWQSIRAPASASGLPMNILVWFPLGLTGLISLQFRGLSRSLLQYHNSNASTFQSSAFFVVQLSHQFMTTGKTIALTIWTFVSKVMCLLYNMLSRFVIAFFPSRTSLIARW